MPRQVQARLRVAACILTALGCGSAANPPLPTPTPANTARSPSALPKDGCEVAAGTPAPTTDPNGPYYHQVVLGRTPDGVTLTSARQVLDHASVPDGARMPDGSVRIYYVNGATTSVWVARLDGDTVTPIGPISLDGVANPRGVVDPDATALPDGRMRLVYLSGFGGAQGNAAMCIADSTDGERFNVVGRAIRFTGTSLTTDPSITPLADGSWLMAASQGQQTALARSPDGLAFTQGETLSYGGVPELSALADGRVRLYVCAQGIESYLSGDSGRTWQREATVVRPGTGGRIVCDPSAVAGTDAFVYKTAN